MAHSWGPRPSYLPLRGHHCARRSPRWRASFRPRDGNPTPRCGSLVAGHKATPGVPEGGHLSSSVTCWDSARGTRNALSLLGRRSAVVQVMSRG